MTNDRFAYADRLQHARYSLVSDALADQDAELSVYPSGNVVVEYSDGRKALVCFTQEGNVRVGLAAPGNVLDRLHAVTVPAEEATPARLRDALDRQ